MRKFKVVGPCTVAGVPPGGTVTEETLEKWGAHVEPLLGAHLDEIQAPVRTTKASGSAKPAKGGDGQ